MLRCTVWVYGSTALSSESVIRSFCPEESIKKVEAWFAKHGLWIIVANRFLAGTRAVVSFCAGMSKLSLLETTILSMLSALAWNAILLTGGYFLGQNWERIGFYLSAYSQFVSALVVIGILVVVGNYFLHQRRRKRTS